MGFTIVPDRCREALIWIADRYDNRVMFMTENGSADFEPSKALALHGEDRRHHFESYLTACAEALEEGVGLRGFFAWSYLENFE